jgi:hypothetical protein
MGREEIATRILQVINFKSVLTLQTCKHFTYAKNKTKPRMDKKKT